MENLMMNQITQNFNHSLIILGITLAMGLVVSMLIELKKGQ